MREKPNPKRLWLQLHLSTCVVLMFVAGVLVWANFYEHQYLKSGPGWHYHGWPEIGVFRYDADEELQYRRDNDLPVYVTRESYVEVEMDWRIWERGGMATNMLVALAILAATAFACERLARRGGKVG